MILRTGRLFLRPQEAGDAAALFAILSDPIAMRFWSHPPITGLAAVEGLMAEQQAAMALGHCRYWTVLEDGDAIGSVDLSLIREGSAELGFLLRRDRWGRGLASEAVSCVIGQGSDTLGLTRLAAATRTANLAAVRLLVKTGFTLKDRREVILPDGARADCDFYVLNRSPTS